jgi:hypothetical protein
MQLTINIGIRSAAGNGKNATFKRKGKIISRITATTAREKKLSIIPFKPQILCGVAIFDTKLALEMALKNIRIQKKPPFFEGGFGYTYFSYIAIVLLLYLCIPFYLLYRKGLQCKGHLQNY